MTVRSTTANHAKHLQIASLQLGIHLPLDRITQLRKTVSAIAGADDDLLHNHASRERVIYRYPLVQYKSISEGAAILGIGDEGCRSLENLIKAEDFTAIFNENGITGIEKETLYLQLFEQIAETYSLQNYIALNQNNLADWHNSPSLPARAALLERCIVGHILKFCSAIKWLLPPKSLQVELLDFRSHTTHAFNNTFLAFDVLFRTNITLPEHIGLGKAVSHGFGLVMSDKC